MSASPSLPSHSSRRRLCVDGGGGGGATVSAEQLALNHPYDTVRLMGTSAMYGGSQACHKVTNFIRPAAK